ncbi:excinuclease ABC subunit UvrB [Pumilibacter intestinalis]|uniref:excinuclease ABC subunit UvrB n=1 Tax=Pumilibacter intestinalis TaxID=2941511 RepID=UPI0020404CFE|nr:excinuclease ABC subunit UvrB [Pumilibacter intestinalis]MCI8487968.1 excinuclease ABC subunit UvrB [Clostridia bacterium]
MEYKLCAPYAPMGDQPEAIDKLCEGLSDGLRSQVLLGVTGSGKTFTMANVIARMGRPALVLAHNKILAAQLCNEFREFFPHNRVEFFVSYYDYYQPEAYIASSDTYIEKDMQINDEIDKLRHSATCSLYERRDTVVVASVSCIYGLGAPEQYYKLAVSLRPGDQLSRDDLIRRLIEINYKRNDTAAERTDFRVKGDTVDIFVASSSDLGVRVEFFGDEIESLSEFEIVSGRVVNRLKHAAIFPASHYAVEKETMDRALFEIERDMEEQIKYFTDAGKLIEAQRIGQRVKYDMEMMREMGYCTGIENYSRYFDGRAPGQPPFTLLDYFPRDFLLFVDESHMTLPQVRAMNAGDRSRKQSLVDYGFRLPAAYDNRPLTFDEFNSRIGQTIYVSATPAPYERDRAGGFTAEQIIRPTGLLDPEITVRPTEGQIDDLLTEIKSTVGRGGRILVTTLTKRMAESLTDYLADHGVRVNYLHSDIGTMERIQIVNALRAGEFDVIVGINLLREGLDIPEVQLVAILDADKEGFLRSESALIQTVGRAARNDCGRVIMYADTLTGSMERAIGETNRRRQKQKAFNDAHGIVPKTIVKPITNTLEITKKEEEKIDEEDIPRQIDRLRSMMSVASSSLDFETAIRLRDRITELRRVQDGMKRAKR